LKTKVDAQAALAAFKLNSEKKETKVRTLNLKPSLSGSFSSTAYLLLFLFFNNTQSYETGIAQTKTFRLPDNEVLLNAASKITFNEKNGKQPRLNTCRRSLFSGAKGKHSAYRLLMVL
jgi:ferric-dicitrate binding protein FerR (iron transport regulator)